MIGYEPAVCCVLLLLGGTTDNDIHSFITAASHTYHTSATTAVVEVRNNREIHSFPLSER